MERKQGNSIDEVARKKSVRHRLTYIPAPNVAEHRLAMLPKKFYDETKKAALVSIYLYVLGADPVRECLFERSKRLPAIDSFVHVERISDSVL